MISILIKCLPDVMEAAYKLFVRYREYITLLITFPAIISLFLSLALAAADKISMKATTLAKDYTELYSRYSRLRRLYLDAGLELPRDLDIQP